MAKNILKNRSNIFLLVTYALSALALVGIISESFFDIDLSESLNKLSILVLGIGLLLISNIFAFRTFLRDKKLKTDEVMSVATAAIAFLIIFNSITEIIPLPFNFSTETSLLITGVAAVILGTLITIQVGQALR